MKEEGGKDKINLLLLYKVKKRPLPGSNWYKLRER